MAKNDSEGKLDTVVGSETTMHGDVRTMGNLRLDGQVEGKADVGGTFLSGPKSLVKGEIHCANAVIAGRVEGDIIARDVVELQSGARIFGNIKCKGLIIQRDCFFEGNCSMSQSREQTSGPGGQVPTS